MVFGSSHTIKKAIDIKLTINDDWLFDWFNVNNDVIKKVNCFKGRVGGSGRNLQQLCVFPHNYAISLSFYTYYTSNESWISQLVNGVTKILFKVNNCGEIEEKC